MATEQRERELQDLFSGRGVHLGRVTDLIAEHYGDREFFEDPEPSPGLHPGGVRTYPQVEEAVARYAAAHRHAGIVEGDRVLILLGNRLDIALHALAVARLGAVAAPVNARLRPAEVDAVREATGATYAIADDEVAARLQDAGVAGGLVWLRTGDTEPAAEDTIARWVVDHPDAAEPSIAGRDPGEVALFLATSGTTGVPKAAALTSRGLLETPGRLGRLPIGTGRRAGRDVVIEALPIPHVMGFGMVLGMMCGGIRVIHRPHFDASEILDLIEERRPNAFIGVPTMYADLEAAGAADRDLSSIQLFASSADAMPEERARRFQTYGSALRLRERLLGNATLVDGYGMVELSGAGAIRLYPPGPSWFRLPSISAVVPGLEVRAVDEDGNRVRAGKVGELQFRGAGVLDRYEGHEDAGPAPDGWFTTGDYARVWPGGLFSFAGRHKDRLKIGGFSVFPAEVETELSQHPEVLEIALVGVPDERLGERPVALVVPSSGSFETDEFLSWAAGQVAGYRAPREAYVVDAIPRGNNDKVDRPAATGLAERLTAEQADAGNVA